MIDITDYRPFIGTYKFNLRVRRETKARLDSSRKTLEEYRLKAHNARRPDRKEHWSNQYKKMQDHIEGLQRMLDACEPEPMDQDYCEAVVRDRIRFLFSDLLDYDKAFDEYAGKYGKPSATTHFYKTALTLRVYAAVYYETPDWDQIGFDDLRAWINEMVNRIERQEQLNYIHENATLCQTQQEIADQHAIRALKPNLQRLQETWNRLNDHIASGQRTTE